ncbi:MAG: hypothetical protein WBF42_07475 [Terracidiphilus sp.]
MAEKADKLPREGLASGSVTWAEAYGAQTVKDRAELVKAVKGNHKVQAMAGI